MISVKDVAVAHSEFYVCGALKVCKVGFGGWCFSELETFLGHLNRGYYPEGEESKRTNEGRKTKERVYTST